ncbi:MAG: RTX toxin [Rhodobacteraceae bacterium]|nr:RTX toxin [Paracoccaceae bacterium]MAY44983.1 RTX toxin [Paracoccaceae bacterium]QEW18294.1 Type I secretion system membrane fusion protein PrsE [Marinibacterium anthonyi]
MTDRRFSARLPLTFGVAALIALVGGFGTWSVMSNIAGAIVSPGRIEVDRNRQVVQHLDGGVVKQILVKEGDSVEAGQVLIRLDDEVLRPELLITEGQLYELMARRGRLEAEQDGKETIVFAPELIEAAADRPDVNTLMEGQLRQFAAKNETVERETEQLEKRRGQIVSQIEGIVAQDKALTRQLTLIQKRLDDLSPAVAEGLVQAGIFLDLQREAARLEGQVGELKAQKAQSEGRITEIDIEILKLGSQRREDATTRLRELQYQEIGLAEEARSMRDKLARLDITAPVSGVVYGLQVHTPRSVIRPADPVLYLVPQDRPLVIAARIDPVNIDQVHLDQRVILRFSAFDQRHTPELMGVVRLVSADAFEDEANQVSFYRAEIELDEGEQEKLPDGLVLIPGMPVEAFIRTADRSPMAYLVKPLSDYFTKAFREG